MSPTTPSLPSHRAGVCRGGRDMMRTRAAGGQDPTPREGEGPPGMHWKGGRYPEVAKGWGRLLSVTNAIQAGSCRQGYSGWA